MSEFHWKKSYEFLGDAIERLNEVLTFPLDEHNVVVDAAIQRFEFSFELFWKTLKRILYEEGIETKTPRETLQKAYHLKWIDDEQLWLAMMHDRNQTSHLYDKEMAQEIFQHIKKYAPVLRKTYDQLLQKLPSRN